MADTAERTYQIACHLSRRADTQEALDEAITGIVNSLRPPIDLAIVFTSGHHVPRIDTVTSGIFDALAPGTLIGSTGLSVVGNDHELENSPGLVVMAANLPGVRFRTFTDSDLDWPRSSANYPKLHEAIGAHEPDLRGVMLFADPFTPIFNLLPALSEGLERSLDVPAIPLFGGVASAGRQPGDNRLLVHDEIRNGGLVGITFSGDVRIDTIVSQGCRPIGAPLVITSGRRNVIESLGGKSALAAFHEIASSLDDEERQLIQDKGLFIGRAVNEYKERFGRGDFLVRNIVGIDQNNGLLMLSDLVRTGQTVQFHVRDARSAHEELAMMLAAQQLDDAPLGGLLFTCNGRGSHLFGQTDHDVTAVRRALPGLPVAGFAAAGEIGPMGGRAFLHSYTACLALLRGV